MKTKMILLAAVLVAGGPALAGDRNHPYGTSGTNTPYDTRDTRYDSNREVTPTTDRRESAYDSAIKPDRTMRHNTREGRASTDYNSYDTDRSNQYRDYNSPGTRE